MANSGRVRPPYDRHRVAGIDIIFMTRSFSTLRLAATWQGWGCMMLLDPGLNHHRRSGPKNDCQSG